MSKETKFFVKNDSFEELQQFASDLIAENAGLKNRIDQLQNQLDQNVNLIAAAPELLEALEVMLSLHNSFNPLENEDTMFYEVKLAKAVIAKARGYS